MAKSKENGPCRQRLERCRVAAQDKVQMYLDRMYLLLQRLKRNRNFSRPAFAGIKADSRDFVEVRSDLVVCWAKPWWTCT
jgi:hypothetical protein